MSLVGKTAGHFKVVSEIGKGGMGVVYEAMDLRLPRRVALKFLADHVGADEGMLVRFKREAESLSRLNHPHICTIYDIGTYRRRPFIAMERLEGQTLRARLQGAPLSFDELLDLGLQIADALGAAHAQGIVHRDVKPGNVFITTRGVAKLLDFGLAKERSQLLETTDDVDASASMPGRPVGTPAYMSPEQIRQSQIDGRSDLFSFGSLLYRMTCGRSPFESESALETIHNILSFSPPPPSSYRPDVPPGLDAVIATLLRKEPGERYATTHELMEALRKVRDAISARSATLASIAVLPFQNTGAGPDDYFGDGLADELITCLARLEGVRVVSRASAFECTRDANVVDIGRQLGVRSVLHGTVRRSGDRVRISARLVEVATGAHLWSDKYDRELRDIFDVQEEIAEHITHALQARLQRYADRPLIRRYTDNPEVYNKYLQGRYWLHQQTLEGFARGFELFNAVLEDEPRFAPALAGLADYHMLIGFFGFHPPMDVWPEAKARAEQAIGIDPSLAEAHTSLALARSHYEWDLPGAQREHQEAIRLSPGDARARYFYGLHLMLMGRLRDAAKEMKHALRLDPLSKQATSALAYIYYYAGDYDGALRECRAAVALDPTYFETYGCKGLTEIMRGNLETAIDAFREADRLTGNGFPLARAFLAYALGLAGKAQEVRELLDWLYATRQQQYMPPTYLAVAEMGLGGIERAFTALDEAYTARDSTLLYLRLLPVFGPLRTDARFEVLCRRLALPEPERAAPIREDETRTA